MTEFILGPFSVFFFSNLFSVEVSFSFNDVTLNKYHLILH
jgi:hypothetical protein